MSDFKPRPGTFLPLMEAEQQRAKANVSPLTLLEILSQRESLSLPLFELQAQSGMEPSRYSEALKNLRSAGYIEIVGDPLDQMVRLTKNGSEVARLARPA